MTSASYGIDAPGVVRNLALASLGAGLLFLFGRHHLPKPLPEAAALTCLICFAEALAMLWTSLAGKRIAARMLVDCASLVGGERVLDVGCGRGLLVIEAARRLGHGRAVGLDLWNAQDLSGNRAAATQANVDLEGLTDRVALICGNALAMPFPDDSFDAVISSLCIHNLYKAEERTRALREVARVLKPGGRAVVQDFRHTAEYATVLRQSGLTVEARRLVRPWLMFPPTWRVVARKPDRPAPS